MTTNSQDRLIGATIDGRYRIQSRIARGGMAGVYLATDLRLERNVAIKIMHGHLVDDPAYAQKFITEARHTARLTHPNIVSVYDQGQEGDILFLVMEYLPGMTLRELLNDFGQLTVEQALDITTAVLQGLDAAHREGIMHRDVKPENVMLVDDGRIKVGDFGLARPVTSATQTGATLMGTIAYISPELLQRGTSDFRSDLYSVGIMLYEMLTGKQPFVGETPMQIAMQHANNPVPRAADLVPELPYELDEVIQWATAKNPQNRPKDALAFRDGIRKAIAHSKANSTESPTEVIDTIEQTRVLDRIDTAATQVIQRPDLVRASTPERAVSTNATGALTTLSANRQRRGKLLAIIAVVVVLLTGGAGWWFGMGPGSLASQISVAGLTADEATAQLTDAGLVVLTPAIEEYTQDVAEGLVIRTDPELTGPVPKGTEVHLVISLGAEPVTLPEWSGQSIADYTSALGMLDISIAANVTRFDDSAPADTIISVVGPDSTPVTAGSQLYRGDLVSLIVSAGPVPDVEGRSTAWATKALEDVGLVVSVSPTTEFSDTVKKGAVIRVDHAAKLAPGDSVTLVISKGPELIMIPEVSGLTIQQAKELLESLGFVAEVSSDLPASLWGEDFAKAVSVDPASGLMSPRGTTITITGAY